MVHEPSSSSASRGRLVTFEGGEGVGKSTHIRHLSEQLKAREIATVVTREPGGTAGAEAIRSLLVTGDTGRWEPLSEALLHFAARFEHVKKLIEPALDSGSWVICDRFADSTMAYQGYGQGLGPALVDQLYRLVLGPFRPDLTIILDMPVEMSMARALHRDRAAGGNPEDRYERMGMAFHTRLRQAFLDIAAGNPERCIVIDAAPAVDQVAGAVWAAVASRLGLN